MEKLLRYNTPAVHFEEALPIGNGQLGAMVYGSGTLERISINHDTLWSGKPGDTFVEGAYESNERALKLVYEGKLHEAQRELENNFTGTWLSSYMLFGNLYIERRGASGKLENYERSLDMESSVVSVSYTEDGIKFEREYFVSYPHNCMMIRIKSDKPADYVLSGDCVGKSDVTKWSTTLCFTGECPTRLAPSYHRDATPIVYEGDGVKVSAFAKAVTDGKYIPDETSTVTIEGATELTVYFVCETSFVAFDKLPDKKTFYPCLERLKELLTHSYEEIRAEHIKDSSALFNRVKTDFGGKSSDKYTDERLKSEDKDLGLCELLYNFGRYLVIAASRQGSKATNLQGIWNDKYYAPWSSNYTLNINAEMNYWPVLMNNLCECNEPIIDLIKNISVNGRETAKRIYHAQGFVSHHNSDLWAHTTPVGNKVENSTQYAYWNMSSGWLMRHLYEHYEYTLDEKFLRETAYPIMIESAKFYLDVMREYNGKWIVTPSTSPENSYNLDGKLIYLAKYTVMSQSIVEDLFTNIIKASEILGIDNDLVRTIKDRCPRLRLYQKGEEGQLLEYDKEVEETDVYHRHVSHLYAFYPADLITTDKDPELSQMVRCTLERRGDEGTGWSMGWKVNLWARLKEGDRALKLVKNQLRYMPAEPDENVDMWHSGGTYANMFDAHPPFQIDGNYGVCAGITQMFLQCEGGKIKILPALPTEMKEGYIKGLLAKGNITVDIEWKENKLSSLKLVTPYEQTAIINIGGRDEAVHLSANKEHIIAI